MGFRPFRVVHILARIGRPLLRLFGIGEKTVAGKVVEAAEIVDPVTVPKSVFMVYIFI